MSNNFFHLIYIHGFQGNDTTFQSFPTDLHRSLSASGLVIRTSIYPTYKSVKPIEHATKEFLGWLSTQPPGPVILIGHSMGGLLAADAATGLAKGGRHHVVGMMAFDVPYLGMHPHVVVSGIASMFDGSDDEDVDGKPKVTEKDLNDERDVNVVDSKVTGDWAGWRRDQPSSPHAPGPPALPNRPSGPRPAPPEHPSRSSIPLTQTASPLPQPKSPMLEQARTFLQSPSIATAPSFLTGGAAFLASHADDPVIKWARKHSDNPLGASKTWIVEHFQFGICMFDPSGLKERYARLVAWDGHWVNYWTQTVPTEIFKRAREREGILDAGLIIPQAPEQSQIDELADNDAALLHTGFSGLKGLSSVTSSSSDQSFHTTVEEPSSSLTKEDNKAQERERKTAEKLKKARQKAKEKEQKRAKKEAERAQKKQEDAIKAKQKAMEKVEKMRTELPTPRHFITLPTGLGAVLGGGERWEKVDIAGVDDEVAAHTGLFIRHQNYDYDGLVLCVAERVRLWCKDL